MKFKLLDKYLQARKQRRADRASAEVLRAYLIEKGVTPEEAARCLKSGRISFKR